MIEHEFNEGLDYLEGAIGGRYNAKRRGVIANELNLPDVMVQDWRTAIRKLARDPRLTRLPTAAQIVDRVRRVAITRREEQAAALKREAPPVVCKAQEGDDVAALEARVEVARMLNSQLLPDLERKLAEARAKEEAAT